MFGRQQQPPSLTVSVLVKNDGFRTPGDVMRTTNTAPAVDAMRPSEYRIAEHTRLLIHCSRSAHGTLQMVVEAVGTHNNIDFRFDTLIRLKHIVTARGAAPSTSTVEPEVGQSRFIFTNCCFRPAIDVTAGNARSLPLPLTIDDHLHNGKTVHFLLELDFICRKDTVMPIYTDSKWSKSSTSSLVVKTDDGKGRTAVFVNRKFLSLYSQRYLRECTKQRTAVITFDDVLLTPCVEYLHQLYTDKALSWSNVFLVLEMAEVFESKSLWRRCANFIVTDDSKPLEFRLANVAVSVRNSDAKWRVLTQLVSSVDAGQLRQMLANGCDAHFAFGDDKLAAELIEQHFDGRLTPTPISSFAPPDRRFDKVELMNEIPHPVVVTMHGVDMKLIVSDGVFEVHHPRPITMVTTEERDSFEVYLRYVYDRHPLPIEKFDRLLQFAVTHQLAWFMKVIEDQTIRHYSKRAAVKGRLTPPSMLHLMSAAYEHRLGNLKTMIGFWVQCADEAYWKLLTENETYAVLAKRFDNFDSDMRQTRIFGWAAYDHRLSAGVRLGVKTIKPTTMEQLPLIGRKSAGSVVVKKTEKKTSKRAVRVRSAASPTLNSSIASASFEHTTSSNVNSSINKRSK